jgi:uncharacterized protein (DUF1778 family)
MDVSNTHDARLDFRLTREDKRIIEEAATVTGQSVSDFAVNSLVEAARQAIERAAVTRMSIRDRDTFLRLIESDAEPNHALKDAARRYKAHRD